MKITAISDLHGFYPKLEGGDLLIVAGDLTARHSKEEALDFIYWLAEQDYKEKIIIAGNHDTFLIHNKSWFLDELEHISKSVYLCDSGAEFEGLRIWGSPWTETFPKMNPKCKAFTVDTEKELAEKWDLIPEDTDILITHSPPYGILDNEHGCVHLRNTVLNSIRLPNLKLHAFGHIHECGGKVFETSLTKFVNSSIMNENYKPVNKPINIDL